MALTKKQKINIENLDHETQLEILRICEESLGLVSVKHAAEALGIVKRTVYDKLNSGKLVKHMRSDNVTVLLNMKPKKGW